MTTDQDLSGFDEPFAMLAACHDRLRCSLRLLERLRKYLAGNAVDEQARQAALEVLRYFTVAAPLHHEDEERHVVPLLRLSEEKALGEVSLQLMQDHEQIRLVWRTLEPLLRDVVRGESPHAGRLADLARTFVRMNESHLEFERDVVFPQARELQGRDGPAARPVMRQDMARRRPSGAERRRERY